MQLQTIISRSLAATESAVLTVGSFHAGTARNIIPGEAILKGTLRTLSPEVRERVLGRLREFVKGLEWRTELWPNSKRRMVILCW